MFGKGLSQSAFSGAAIACGLSEHVVSSPVRQHVCLVEFWNYKNSWVDKRDRSLCTLGHLSETHIAWKGPNDLLSLSQVTQPLGFQEALLLIDRSLHEAFLA